MTNETRLISILIAEDDEDDRQWVKEALMGIASDLFFVKDGEELMDCLNRRGQFAGESEASRPRLIILDLNMPRKDGREALKEIKTDPKLRQIPVVVLTTSTAEDDVVRSYELGANTVIHKPVTYNDLIKSMHTLGDYWFHVARLPADSN